MPKLPEEVIERRVQMLGEQVRAGLPKDVHFLLVAYRARDGKAFLAWVGTGTIEDRKNAIRELSKELE